MPSPVTGFEASFVAASRTPEVDGYVGMRGGWPFHVHPDATPHEWSQLSAAIADGTIRPTAHIPVVRTIEDHLSDLRAQRDILLAQCDWTMLADAPLTDEQKTAWIAYRKALRDLPFISVDPENPSWPGRPA